jgi:hypothetical protein
LTVILAVTIFINFTSDALAGCTRVTNDAGRWKDAMKPSDRLAFMCTGSLDYYEGEAGKMILQNRNGVDCNDLVKFAKEQEKWQNDWFLWSEITCDNKMRAFIK